VDSSTGASLHVLTGESVWVVPPAPHARPYRILGVRDLPKGPVLALEGVSDLSTAELLRGRTLLVDAALAPQAAPEADELDIIGFEVVDETRGTLGSVGAIIVTGANDVLEVGDGPFGEVLIPVIDQVILNVDEDARRIDVRLLDGLLED